MARHDFDIVVIGAGIAGSSLAAELAQSARVLLLEAEQQAGYHATGRSAAYFSSSYGSPAVRAFTRASEAFFCQPPAGFTDTALLHQRDTLYIARPDQRQQLEALVAEQPSLTELDSACALQRVPVLDSHYVDSALLDRDGGDLDVDALLQGYLRLFKARGGKLLCDASTQAIQRSGQGWRIDTNGERIRAATVVNAAGAWAVDIGQMAGFGTLGLQPKRRTALLIKLEANEGFQQWPLTVDIDEQFYFKPDAGLLLLSPADATPSIPCDARPEELDIAIAIERLQQATTLKVDRVEHKWAGLRTFAVDGEFVVGADPRDETFFWYAGQGGYGVQAAPALARFAAQLLGASSDGPDPGLLSFAKVLSPARLL
jgi:D-arginine dehydrogenase